MLSPGGSNRVLPASGKSGAEAGHGEASHGTAQNDGHRANAGLGSDHALVAMTWILAQPEGLSLLSHLQTFEIDGRPFRFSCPERPTKSSF